MSRIRLPIRDANRKVIDYVEKGRGRLDEFGLTVGSSAHSRHHNSNQQETMMSRTPPSSARYTSHTPIPVYIFEKNEGSVSSTFIGRIIHRIPIRLALRSGGTIDAVRYAGRYWPIYKPETFAEKSRQWVNKGDTLYDHGYSELKMPLKHAFLFDADTPRGFYD